MPNLTTIPLELRQEIYSYLLIDSNVAGLDAEGEMMKPKYSTSLFRVNKQISEESSGYFYAKNSFVLVHWLAYMTLDHWEARMGFYGRGNYLSISSNNLDGLSPAT